MPIAVEHTDLDQIAIQHLQRAMLRSVEIGMKQTPQFGFKELVL